jgi:hypothetical protein
MVSVNVRENPLCWGEELVRSCVQGIQGSHHYPPRDRRSQRLGGTGAMIRSTGLPWTFASGK